MNRVNSPSSVSSLLSEERRVRLWPKCANTMHKLPNVMANGMCAYTLAIRQEPVRAYQAVDWSAA